MVREMTNIWLAKRNDDIVSPTVGQNWIYNFIKYTPALKIRFSCCYNYWYTECEDPKIIQIWFGLVCDTIIKYSIYDNDIYNFDKTGFAMNLILRAQVITKAEYYKSKQKIL